MQQWSYDKVWLVYESALRVHLRERLEITRDIRAATQAKKDDFAAYLRALKA